MKFLWCYLLVLAAVMAGGLLTAACGDEEEEEGGRLMGSPAAPTPGSGTATREATPELAPPAEPTLTPVPKTVWSDGRVGITIDKVERLDAMPPEFSDSPHLKASYAPGNEGISFVEWGGRPPPRDGYDYVALYLTIAHIEVEHVGYCVIGGIFDREMQPSILIDAKGNRYQEKAFWSRGLRFRDQGGLTETYEIIKDTTMVLVFELPRQEEPAILEFVYPFSDSELWRGWEEKSIAEWGQIEVTL